MRCNPQSQWRERAKRAARVCSFLLCSNTAFYASERHIGWSAWVEQSSGSGYEPVLWVAATPDSGGPRCMGAIQDALNGDNFGLLKNQSDSLKPSQNFCDFCCDTPALGQRRDVPPSVRFLRNGLLKGPLIDEERVSLGFSANLLDLFKSYGIFCELCCWAKRWLIGGHL